MKPVISPALFDWMNAKLPAWQHDRLLANVEVHDPDPPAPPVDDRLDRERLAADLDRIRREDEARRKLGATPTLTAFDETRGWSGPAAPAGEPTFDWTAAPGHVDEERFIRDFQRELGRGFRRLHLGEWLQSRSDDPELKPYYDVIDKHVKELARETDTPEEFLRF